MSTASRALADPQVRAEWEKETAATLKRLGFPTTETVCTSASILPKAMACVTKRLEKLGEFVKELEEVAQKDAKEASSAKEAAKKDPNYQGVERDILGEPIAVKILALPICERSWKTSNISHFQCRHGPSIQGSTKNSRRFTWTWMPSATP